MYLGVTLLADGFLGELNFVPTLKRGANVLESFLQILVEFR
jgi:hypothetical protein